MAATAFFVSVCSLFIYIYQSKILSEQQQVAVWPYVQWARSDIDGFQLLASNKGVGPALVRKMDMRYKGKAINSNRELLEAVMGPSDEVIIHNSAVLHAVISPGEKITFLSIPDKASGKTFAAKFNRDEFVLNITYCSIYGRCWVTSGFTGKRTADDKNIDY